MLRIRVSDGADRTTTAVIGHTRDASIEGCFLCTTLPLRVGDLLPISLTVPSEKTQPDIQAEMEVVRVTSEGAGLRIRSMSNEDRRRFRRLIAQANSVVGTRSAAERVLDADRRTTTPIREPGQIRSILSGATSARLRMVAVDQDRMWEGAIDGVRGGRLGVRVESPPEIDTALFVVLDHAHVNYAFSTVVQGCRGARIELSLPAELGFAERRSRERAAVDDSVLVLPLPGRPGSVATFDVLERGEGGFSFQAPATAWLLAPGAVLVEIDPRYFRPAEVDLLIGDATKAHRVLGWRHQMTWEAVCSEMVHDDLIAVAKEHRRNAD